MNPKIWLATTNKGKVDEFKLLFAKALPGASIHSLAELGHYYPPPENGKTFVENATIKARSLHSLKPDDWVVADDSGLEVTGLGNLPGIHSARYAGDKASDGENLAKLLKMMQIRGIQDRSARFVCSLVAYGPNKVDSVGKYTAEVLHFEAELKGLIASKPSGQLGFGYDPVFIPDGQSKSMAELGPAFKNQHSHRALATLKLAAALAEKF